MSPETERLIHSLDEKMDLLTKIMFGENGVEGIHDDVKLIKRKLIGDPEFQEEGLIAMVHKHNEFYKKMQNIGWFATAVLGFGSVMGGVVVWFAHRWDIIKELIIKN